MKSGQIIGGLIAGSVVGAAIGYTMRSPKRKSMKMMRKGLKALRMM